MSLFKRETREPDASELARRMVKGQLACRGIADERVLNAMRRVPRHRFVPGQPLDAAYADRALPVAQGQTISQPYMVARMTELLDATPGARVLEVGTGSGYQAAVLLQMGARLVTVERHAELADAAQRLLSELYRDADCTVIHGDGTLGCEAHAPYDRILVTAGAPDLPATLEQQLADPGRIVIPTGPRDSQILMLYERHGHHWSTVHDVACRFVPLVGEQGWYAGEG